MEITIPLMDIIDSHKSYLKTKLGVEFTSMEAFKLEPDSKTAEIKKVATPELYGKIYITFKK